MGVIHPPPPKKDNAPKPVAASTPRTAPVLMSGKISSVAIDQEFGKSTNLSTSASDFFSLMRNELIAPLEEMRNMSRRVEHLRVAGKLPDSLADEDVFRRLTTTSRDIAAKLETFAKITELVGKDGLLTDLDRIETVKLVQNAADQQNVRAFVRGPEELAKVFGTFGTPAPWMGGAEAEASGNAEMPGLSSLYGSIPWLTMGIGIYLKAITISLRSGRPEAVIRQLGDHQLITIGSRLDVEDFERPGTSEDSLELELTLANRVIELHGGEVRLTRSPPRNRMDKGMVQQIIVSLPSGGGDDLHPPLKQCTTCKAALQNYKLAKDYGELSDRIQALEDTSPEVKEIYHDIPIT
jgi:hypothetical protein